MKTILLVEDTEDDVFFLKRALKDARIPNPLHVVVDGQQALDYLEGKGRFEDREKYPLPFLILLDLKLPYIMGLEVLKWIRGQPALENTLVVVLTSSQLDKDMEATRLLGGNGYLTKPPSGDQFIELVQTLRDRWSL